VILIVDDCRDISSALRRLLEHNGCGVTCLSSAEEGLAFLQSNPAQMVILDQNLPGRSGTDMQQHMRQDGVMRDIPVLFFTVEDSGRASEIADRDGALGWVIKNGQGWQTVVNTAKAMCANPAFQISSASIFLPAT
jgi:DNA-binding response OmpR family regulator